MFVPDCTNVKLGLVYSSHAVYTKPLSANISNIDKTFKVVSCNFLRAQVLGVQNLEGLSFYKTENKMVIIYGSISFLLLHFPACQLQCHNGVKVFVVTRA